MIFKSLLKRIFPAEPNAALKSQTDAGADELIAEGNRCEDAGELGRACELYRQAASAAPGYARAHLNLGIVLTAMGDGAGAANAYEAVLRIDPHNAFGNYNFARLAFLQGDLPRAEALLREALKTKPGFPDALVILSKVLEATGKNEPALESLLEALRLKPDNFGALYGKALLLDKLHQLDEAEAAIKQALALEPLDSDALRLLSILSRKHGLAIEARAPLRLAIDSGTGDFSIHSDELYFLNFDESAAASDIYRRHAEFGARLEAAFPVRFKRFLGSGDKHRRLRVGYVSGDFNFHTVAFFMVPVFEHHNRENVELLCYSSSARSDHVTDQFHALCDSWVDATGMSDSQLADRIHADAIDILVDLTGHTGWQRLAVFSERPAPVQVTWLGYLNTTGLTRMDYRLCDRSTDPIESSQPLHTEKLLQLPNSQWCYRPFAQADVAASAPFEKNGYITFGSFNSALKISPEMCRRWMELLLRMPRSRLVVANADSERKRAAIRLVMAEFAVSSERVEFFPRVPVNKYLQLFNLVDISLDTHPYGGGTTTFDSLWMGVPVVTATGSIPVSRSASSILLALGLYDWIAPSIDSYVDLAEERASDRQGISLLRRSLRQAMKDSPLTDVPRFVRDLESAYREMWIARTDQPGLESAASPSTLRISSP